MTLVFAWRSQDGTRGRKPMPAEGYGSQAVKPEKPTLIITSGNGQMVIEWEDGFNGGAEITRHRLYSSTTPNFVPSQDNLVTEIEGPSPFIHVGLQNGVIRYYKLSAVNIKGEGAFSLQGSGMPQAVAPSMPTITVQSGNGQNTIGWVDGDDGGSPILGHRIHRSSTVDFVPSDDNFLDEVTGPPPYIDDTAPNGTPSYYRVVPFNAVGAGEPSPEGNGTPQADPPSAAILDVIAGVGANNVTWTVPNDGGAPIEEVEIHRSTAANFVPGPSTILTITEDGSPYLDEGLTPGTTYFYVVFLISAGGRSPVSNKDSGQPTAAPTVPQKPLLTVTAGIGRNTLSWTDQLDGGRPIEGHFLYKSTNPNFTPSLSNRVGDILSGSPYIDLDVTNNQEYFYILSAHNEIGEGAYSDKKSGIPQATPTISLLPITAVAEGSSGAPGVITLTAQRNNTNGAASCAWAVTAGFAGNPVDPSDFPGGVFPSGVFNFADGQPQATATITLAGDSVVEPDETGLVTISAPTSPYVIGTASQSFLVVNDDSYPTISLNIIAPRAEGSSAFPAVVNVSAVRSNTTGPASCAWAVSAGGGANPLSPADFPGNAFPSGTLNWADGQTTASASFTLVGDSVAEPDETGLVTLSAPSAGYVLGTSQQPFIIEDDDTFQPLSAPVIAGLGASRVRQSLVQSGSLGATLNSNHVVGGMLTWIQALDPRYTYTNWIEQTAPYINSSYHDGLTFANDGEGFPQMRLRVPKLRSSRANIVMMDLSSNSVNGNYDLNGYCNQAKELITLMRAVGKVVGVLSLVERGAEKTGGLWAVGQQWRTNVPTINAEMQSWCATQQGVFFVDIRSVLVKMDGTVHDPLAIARGDAYDATRDETHWSQRGAYEAAKKWNEAAAPFISGSAEASRMVSGGSNKYSNPNFTGSNPVASQANLSGVQPNNCTVNYNSSNASTVAMSLVDRGGGKFGLRATINRSAMVDGTMEGIGLSMTAGVSAFVVGKWYTASMKATTNNAPGLATICATQLIDGGNKAVRGGCGINAGGSATVTNYIADLPGEVRTGKFETSSLKAINTGVSTFGASAAWGKGDGSTLVIDFFDPTVIEVDDPHLLQFDGSDVSTPTITSNADFSFPEEAVYTIQGAGSKPGYWSLTGTDAALFRVTNWGEISNRVALDYENPTDGDKNNVYSFNLVLTPFDIRDAAVTKAMTWTATDIDDGFSDNFGRTVGMSLGAEVPQQWRPTGAATSALDLQVGTSNRLKSVNTGVSDKTGTRLAPRQLKAGADNYEQRISFNRGVSASTAFPQCFVVYKDDLNYISVQADTANFLSLWRRAAGLNSGARTKIATYAYDDAYGINILAQRIGSEIQVFQGGVRLSPATGSENVGTILQDAYDSGLGNWGALAEMLGFWNNRNAVPLVPKIGLKKLTPAVTSISVAEAANTGINLNNLTDGSGRQIKTVTGTGSANAANVLSDGSTVKIKEGAAGETYVITVTEIPSDPINTVPSAGRDSTLAQITLTT